MINAGKIRLVATISVILFSLPLTLFSAPEKLAVLNETYEKELEKINISHMDQVQKSRYKHVQTMQALKLNMQKKGKLEAILAIDKEIERFEADAVINREDLSDIIELRMLQNDFIKVISLLPMSKAKQVVKLAEKYDAALESYQTDLTKAGKIEDAIAVKNARKDAQLRPEVTSARFAVDQAAADKPKVIEKKIKPEVKVAAAVPASKPDKIAKKWTGSTSNHIKRRFDKLGKCVADQEWAEAKQYLDPRVIERISIDAVKSKLRREFDIFSLEQNKKTKVGVDKVTLNEAEDSAVLVPKIRVKNTWRSIRDQTWILFEGDWYLKIGNGARDEGGDEGRQPWSDRSKRNLRRPPKRW